MGAGYKFPHALKLVPGTNAGLQPYGKEAESRPLKDTVEELLMVITPGLGAPCRTGWVGEQHLGQPLANSGKKMKSQSP